MYFYKSIILNIILYKIISLKINILFMAKKKLHKIYLEFQKKKIKIKIEYENK